MGFKEKLHHENWPMPIFYTPVFLYYLYNSLKYRKLNYFTAVNPALDTGGMCGFSKYESFKLLPPSVIPTTILLENESYSESQIGDLLNKYDLSFPLIVKPDQGERGFLVFKVDTIRELTETLGNKTLKLNFLIQEYIDTPLELGLFVIKRDGSWRVSSITSKNFLSVTGDGALSVEELIETDARGKKYFDQRDDKIDLKRVPLKGEAVILEPIGNHCRGTRFVNECDKISDDMHVVFNELLLNLEGVNYCRLDIRTKSWESLLSGDIKVMEVNGVSAEPGHIYDQSTSVFKAYKDLLGHWNEMAVIAGEQLSSGSKSEKLFDTLNMVRNHMKSKKEMMKLKSKVVDVVGCPSLDLTWSPETILNKFSAQNLIENHKCSPTEESYERTILYKDSDHEIVFCHWRSGDKSPVHSHPNTECWFRCLSGGINEIRDMGKNHCTVEEGCVVHINDSMGAHQMLNMSDECTYTLHLYTKID